MKNIALFIGTRPEAIKVIPVYLALKSIDNINPILISTGQHQQLLEDVFSVFDCYPDIRFNVMNENQTLSQLTINLIDVVDKYLQEQSLSAILVQGDTTTSMISGMVGFYYQIPIGHIEAGLRTDDIYSPFPEEFNRRVISLFAKWHFTPTEISTKKLELENISGSIYQVGNTVIDAAIMISSKQTNSTEDLLNRYPFINNENKKHILITMHRRETFGQSVQDVCQAIKHLAQNNPNIEFLFPVHPNPNVKIPIYKLLDNIKNIQLTTPLTYDCLLFVMKNSFLIMTDSGGIQEEAPTFNVPVMVLREKTERIEAIKAGCCILVGTSTKKIINTFTKINENPDIYNNMSSVCNPYGDGKSSQLIAQILSKELL